MPFMLLNHCKLVTWVDVLAKTLGFAVDGDPHETSLLLTRRQS